MKKVAGVLLLLLAVVVGLYVGVWYCFIGGIVGGIHVLFVGPFNAYALAWDILRVLSASFVGWLSAAIIGLPGYALLTSD